MGPAVDYYTNINASIFFVVSSACKYPEEVTKIFLDACLLWNEDGKDYIQEVKELEAKYYPADWQWNSSNPNRMMTTEREYRTV